MDIQCIYNSKPYIMVNMKGGFAKLVDTDGSFILAPSTSVVVTDLNVINKVNALNTLMPTPTEAPTTTPAPTPVIKTYIIAGQSNAEGYGQSSLLPTLAPNIALETNQVEILPARDFDFSDYNDFYSQINTKTLEPLVTQGQEQFVQWGATDVPVNNGILGGTVTQAGPNTFGIELSLGRTLQSEYNEKVYIIKFTRGGSAISEWNPAISQSLYTKMMDMVNRAIVVSALRGEILDFRGLFWLQGEADALTSLTPNYGDKFSTIIDNLRSDIGVSANDFKVVSSEIVDSQITGSGTWFGGGPNPADGLYSNEDDLNDQLKNHVTSLNTHTVPADDITSRGDIAGQHGATVNGEYTGIDGFHYNSSEYIKLGERMAQKMVE